MSPMNYDREFSEKRKRRVVPKDREELFCSLCKSIKIDSGSDYEWPCLITMGWVCETHCDEVKMSDYADTRLTFINRFKLDCNENQIVEIFCKKCPYYHF